MTNEEIYAWILLSVPEKPVKLHAVLLMADAINHAVPTEAELQKSFRWLKSEGLVQKQGKHYSLTELGKEIVSEAGANSQSMMQTWKVTTEKLRYRGHGG